MANFPRGTITEKQGTSGIYQEIEFRLSQGQTIPVFYASAGEDGEEDPISELLESEISSEAVYSLLLIIRVLHRVTYGPVIPHGTLFNLVTKEIQSDRGDVIKRNDLVRGKIVDPAWDATSLSYQAIATPRLYEQRYTLLETEIGYVVINHAALQKELSIPLDQITPGGYLEWKIGRIDLLAIIERQKLS